MATEMKQLPARTTAVQRAMLDQVGPVGVSTRALLWIGLAASGQPIPAEARREVLSLLGEDLAPGVLDALQRLADQLLRGDTGPAVAPLGAPAPTLPRAPAPRTPERTEPPPAAGRAGPTDDPYGEMGVEYDG